MNVILNFHFLFILGGGISLFFGINAFIKKRKIENTPTSKIRSLAMGVVELNGSAVWKEKLISPMSQNPCVYYDAEIQEYRKSGKSGKYVTIGEEKKGELFFVQDETGKVMVDASNAKIDVKTKSTYKIGRSLLGRQRMEELCKRHNINTMNFLGLTRRLRVIETLIRPNQGLYVLGNAVNNPYVKDGSVIKNEDDILIKKSKKQNLIISDKTEREIIRKNLLISTILIPLGSLLVAIGIWFLFIVFKGG